MTPQSELEKLLERSRKMREKASCGPYRLGFNPNCSDEQPDILCEKEGYSMVAEWITKENGNFICHTLNTSSAKDEIISVLSEALKEYAPKEKWNMDKIREPMKSLDWHPGMIAEQALDRAERIAAEVNK